MKKGELFAAISRRNRTATTFSIAFHHPEAEESMG
jgi:hypothetical protein